MKHLEYAFEDSIEFVYIDALFEPTEFDFKVFIPHKYKDNKTLKSYVKVYSDKQSEGFEENANHIIKFVNENGPFDGWIGFSMGANMMTAILN